MGTLTGGALTVLLRACWLPLDYRANMAISDAGVLVPYLLKSPVACMIYTSQGAKNLFIDFLPRCWI